MSVTQRRIGLAIQVAEAKLWYWEKPKPVHVSIPILVDLARETVAFLGGGALPETNNALANAIVDYLVPRYGPQEVLHEIAKHALEKLEEVKHG